MPKRWPLAARPATPWWRSRPHHRTRSTRIPRASRARSRMTSRPAESSRTCSSWVTDRGVRLRALGHLARNAHVPDGDELRARGPGRAPLAPAAADAENLDRRFHGAAAHGPGEWCRRVAGSHPRRGEPRDDAVHVAGDHLRPERPQLFARLAAEGRGRRPPVGLRMAFRRAPRRDGADEGTDRGSRRIPLTDG